MINTGIIEKIILFLSKFAIINTNPESEYVF